MQGYQTRIINVPLNRFQLRLKALKDRNQYYDPQGKAKKAGIPEAYWSLFGQLWPAGKALAKAVKKLEVGNKRILELGCGLALPSLVLKKKGADVTASDLHPLSEHFLDYNCALNELEPIPFTSLNWAQPHTEAGQFDLIIASDVLYKEQHIEQLAHSINTLAKPKAKILLTCPGRGYRNKFSKLLEQQGFAYEYQSIPLEASEQPPFKGRLLTFTR